MKPDILPIHQLNWHALQYAIYIAKVVENKIRAKRLKDKSSSYPPCAACVQSLFCGSIGYGYTGQYKLVRSNFRSPLGSLLTKKLGPISSQEGRCANYIGKCAEVSAVNSLFYNCMECKTTTCQHILSAHVSKYIIKKHLLMPANYSMSAAYRPRTQEYIERCENCIALFP